jgi:hypothetical protein
VVYMDRDADLNTPATTPSGCVDGMVVSHLTGRGAAELVRFWAEPPLVRDPDLVLFGVARLDPPEEEFLSRSTLRRYLASDVQRMGARAAASEAIERIHSRSNEFILHLDVDVIADFAATNYPGSGGLSLDEVREALMVFAQQKHLAVIEVTAYNPAKDSDGSGAKVILDLLAEVLAARLEKLKQESAVAPSAQAPAAALEAVGGSGSPQETEPAPAEPASESSAAEQVPPAAPGEAWSSEEQETEETSAAAAEDPSPAKESTETEESQS